MKIELKTPKLFLASPEEEIKKAVSRFIGYVEMGWEVKHSFEIAYDSVYDIIKKEEFLNSCQFACSTKVKNIT